jgi:repressor LexA
MFAVRSPWRIIDMSTLTPRQQELYGYLAEFLAEQGYPPSYREIAEALGIRSTNGVSAHLNALERKGYIERPSDGGRARALRLTGPAPVSNRTESVAVPVVGRVAAGMPIAAIEHVEEYVHVDSGLLPKQGEVFALRVSGDSMIEDGILEGDLVVVRKQEHARNREIVVAMVDGEATVKRLRREANGRMALIPSNRTMAAILVPPGADLGVLGVVVGLYRRF